MGFSRRPPLTKHAPSLGHSSGEKCGPLPQILKKKGGRGRMQRPRAFPGSAQTCSGQMRLHWRLRCSPRCLLTASLPGGLLLRRSSRRALRSLGPRGRGWPPLARAESRLHSPYALQAGGPAECDARSGCSAMPYEGGKLLQTLKCCGGTLARGCRAGCLAVGAGLLTLLQDLPPKKNKINKITLELWRPSRPTRPRHAPLKRGQAE
ncbi:hypothetical protein DQ04_08101000 [Trypanosoma grayi]|uniref:hypothetical protein n=1 Tax=Trypanosoma grayi TaxID=71804 RepID=UPI0004F4A833|nr:hypothetical protein DQ04_08101000 [Trypanosoma grayi]KEG08063.1 hypothetical protein DQ04_08101000 [Trypanosoma grayi]